MGSVYPLGSVKFVITGSSLAVKRLFDPIFFSFSFFFFGVVSVFYLTYEVLKLVHVCDLSTVMLNTITDGGNGVQGPLGSYHER